MSTLQKLLKNSYKGKKQDKHLDGYTRDDTLSGQRAQVYHNKDTGKTVVTHRGTKGFNDIITDLKLAVAPKLYRSSTRYKHAKDIQKKAEAKYGNDNITTIGHSLGGKLASDVGREGDKIITYNRAVVPSELNRKNDKEIHIRTSTDPVSFLSPYDKTKTITVQSDSFAGSHDIENLQNYHPKNGADVRFL